MNEDTYRDKLTDLQLEVEELREKLAQSTMGQVNDLSQSTKTDTISRQAAIDALKSQLSDWNDDYNIPVRKSIENIERLPSAQPEIIRCKDCEWWEKQKDSLQGRCALMQMYPTGGWFCGNARERRTDE